MNDIYTATYDVVSKKIGYFNGDELIEKISSNFQGVDQYFRNMTNEISYEMTRPSIVYRLIPFRDGNQWCALLGENIQEGIVGFGVSPSLALIDFDNNFHKAIKQ